MIYINYHESHWNNILDICVKIFQFHITIFKFFLCNLTIVIIIINIIWMINLLILCKINIFNTLLNIIRINFFF